MRVNYTAPIFVATQMTSACLADEKIMTIWMKDTSLGYPGAPKT